MFNIDIATAIYISSLISQEIAITIVIDHKQDLIWPADVDANADITVTTLHQDNNKIKSDLSYHYTPGPCSNYNNFRIAMTQMIKLTMSVTKVLHHFIDTSNRCSTFRGTVSGKLLINKTLTIEWNFFWGAPWQTKDIDCSIIQTQTSRN